jgi:hypothetical protein
MIGIPLLTLWNDSRFNSATYNCDGERSFALATNSPGGTHWADIRVEGAVGKGEVAIAGFPVDEPTLVFTAGASVSMSYASELYGPIDLNLSAKPGAECQLRITYRLKSDLSLVNPLW